LLSFFDAFDHWNIFAPVILFSLPVYWFIGRYFFSGWDDFLDHLRLLYQPFWLSALRGEFNEDMWAELKLLIYFLICASWAFGVTFLLIKLVA
jgi:hypothetical protein